MSAETLRASEVSTPRWATLLKRVTIIAGVVVALLVVLRPLVNDPPQKGPDGSSFATVEGGVAALADLAATYNYPVSRRTTSLDQSATTDPYPLATNSVLVVLNAEVSNDAANDLALFVRRGGTLVASVDRPGGWTSLIADAVDLDDSFPKIDPNRQTGDTVGNASTSESSGLVAKQLRVIGTQSFHLKEDEGAQTIPVDAIAFREGLPIAVTVSIDAGQMTLVSDASMFTNAQLDKADNAAFALELLGSGLRPIVFAEEPHGFRSSLTPTGLPKNVRHFLWGLVAATVLLMITRGKRNGPPELAHRELAPPRSLYLTSMATSLDKLERGPRERFRRAPSAPTASPIPHPDTVAPDQPETR